MYYLVYGFLYLISLLPSFILYGLSDLVSFLLYYVFGYRKKVVMYNLSIAFPEKSVDERKAIAKNFYKNFIDTFIETIMMISMSEKQFDKKCTVEMDAANELAKRGKNIQVHLGHQMNWEYGNWVMSKHFTIPWIGIYSQISNKVMNKIFYDLRSRFKSIMISTTEFKHVMHTLFKTQYSIGLAADQNIGSLSGYWMYFFTKPVPFITGPEKGATKNGTAVVFLKITRLKKRGHFHFETEVVTENAAGSPPGELTRKYRDFLEKSIREQPENYLWTHRRWRHDYRDDFKKLWMDTRQL